MVWTNAPWRSPAGSPSHRLLPHRLSRHRLPRRLLIVAAVALIPAVAGCEAGNNAPTLDWHQPTEGAGTAVHGMSIRNVFVLGGSGTSVLPAGSSTSLFFALFNTGPADRLVSVQAPGTASSVSVAGGAVQVRTDSAARLTGPRPAAVLNSLNSRLRSGTDITIVFNFARLGSITMRVPVIPRARDFATFSAPAPTPSATRHARVRAGGTASPAPSPSVSTSP